MIVTEGPLKQYFDVFDKEIQLKGEPGVLVRVPAVAGANDGLRPTFVVADETHEWTGSKARVHLVLENGLAKRQDSWSPVDHDRGESEGAVRRVAAVRVRAEGARGDDR
jgi:hypothetical protein